MFDLLYYASIYCPLLPYRTSGYISFHWNLISLHPTSDCLTPVCNVSLFAIFTVTSQTAQILPSVHTNSVDTTGKYIGAIVTSRIQSLHYDLPDIINLGGMLARSRESSWNHSLRFWMLNHTNAINCARNICWSWFKLNSDVHRCFKKYIFLSILWSWRCEWKFVCFRLNTVENRQTVE